MKRIASLFVALAVLAFAGQAQAADAFRTYTISHQGKFNIITWANLDGDDTGVPVSINNCLKPLSIQIGTQSGDTHGGGTYVLQGSDDAQADPAAASHSSAVWLTMKDINATAISRTTADLYASVGSPALWLRPSSSGGTAADIDVVLVCQQQ